MSLSRPLLGVVHALHRSVESAATDRHVKRLLRCSVISAEGADVLIYDAQYLPEEYAANKRGWGHSHWREAINVIMESGAKELVLFHHDPDHDDRLIDKVVEDARNYYPRVRAAAEGMEVRISAAR